MPLEHVPFVVDIMFRCDTPPLSYEVRCSNRRAYSRNGGNDKGFYVTGGPKARECVAGNPKNSQECEQHSRRETKGSFAARVFVARLFDAIHHHSHC